MDFAATETHRAASDRSISLAATVNSDDILDRSNGAVAVPTAVMFNPGAWTSTTK